MSEIDHYVRKGHWRRASGVSQISCLAFIESLEMGKPARLRLLFQKTGGGGQLRHDTHGEQRRWSSDVGPPRAGGDHQIQPLREERENSM
jgi:hypothetical protein